MKKYTFNKSYKEFNNINENLENEQIDKKEKIDKIVVYRNDKSNIIDVILENGKSAVDEVRSIVGKKSIRIHEENGNVDGESATIITICHYGLDGNMIFVVPSRKGQFVNSGNNITFKYIDFLVSSSSYDKEKKKFEQVPYIRLGIRPHEETLIDYDGNFILGDKWFYSISDVETDVCIAEKNEKETYIIDLKTKRIVNNEPYDFIKI